MSRILLAATSCILIAATISARDEKDTKYFKLIHVETGKALCIENASDEAEARAIIAKEDGKNLSQQWKLEKDGDYYKIVNRKSGKVLDVFENSTDSNAAIIQWDDKAEDNDNQRWNWEGEGTERRLKSKSSGMVLVVDDEDKATQKKSNSKSKIQLWKLVEIK